MSDQLTSVVLATHNAHKLTELRRMLAGAAPEIELLGLAEVAPYPEPAETELTFEGNALLKARACLAATGRPAMADDSGLAVDVLNGMPGVRSARWAGTGASDADNNELLLRQLDDVADERRRAIFVCAMALVLPDGSEHVRRGEMSGRLARACSGHNGFGYDPLFLADATNTEARTADGCPVSNGELSGAAKDALSHRGRAVRAIVAVLAGLAVPTMPGIELRQEGS